MSWRVRREERNEIDDDDDGGYEQHDGKGVVEERASERCGRTHGVPLANVLGFQIHIASLLRVS